MNKRFFTLMAAVMLAGSPFVVDQAFAADNYAAVQFASTAKFANGVKFKISDGSNFYTVTPKKDKSGVAYVTGAVASVSNVKDGATFEVRNFSSSTAGVTFELYVDGVKYAVDKDGNDIVNNTTESKDVRTLFSADDDLLDSVTKIVIASVGSTPKDVIGTAKLRYVSSTTQAADLNANLSGRGFKFSFPGAASQPDANPFANQMIAIPAQTVADVNALDIAVDPIVGPNDVCFVLADEKGLKLLNAAATDADYKAATYVIVNPVGNFGITGLDFSKSAGQGFTYVKGSQLAALNTVKDGAIEKYNFENAVYAVSEADMLNAEGEYALKSTVDVFTKDDPTYATNTVNIGAYSLMAGGLKTFITTVPTSMANKLAKAQTGGDTYAQAADLLKTSGAAVYNIFFTGDATGAGGAGSWYGKYLTSVGAYAPKYVDLTRKDAQWIVTEVGAKGQVTLVNAYDKSQTFKGKLYKTAQAGVYELNGGSTDVAASMGVGADVIKLVAAQDNGTFLTLNEEQLKQTVSLTFSDDQTVNVSELYVVWDDVKGYVPSKSAKDAEAWYVEEAKTINNIIEYAYLKNNEVAKANDTTKVKTYYFFDYDLDGDPIGLTNYASINYTLDYTTAASGVAPTAEQKAAAWKQFAFEKVGGSYKMIEIAKGALTTDASLAAAYNSQILGATYTYADVASSELNASSAPASFYKVNLNFVSPYVGGDESLAAEPRYATLNSEEGGVSLKENKNGILEGVIAAEGLTLWLDTANTADEFPTFLISKGIAADTTATKAVEAGSVRNFMYYPADSACYWNAASAKYVSDKKYTVDGSEWVKDDADNSDLKAIFRPAALANSETLNTVAGGKDVTVTDNASSI